MKSESDSWKDAVALADRIGDAAKDQPANEVFLAMAILLGYTINRVSRSKEDADAELRKFLVATTGIIEELRSPAN